MCDEANADNNCFVGEFRKNQECANGISIDDLKRVVAQLDLSSLPCYEKYKLEITSFSFYSNDLNSNDYQKSIKKFIFSNGILQEYSENILTGEFLLITITGFNNSYGQNIAYILYKK